MQNEYYYTFLQFAKVAFFLFYTIGLLTTIAIISFRNKRGIKISYMLGVLVLLTGISISRFICEVSLYENLTHILKIYEGMAVLVILALFMAFLAQASHRFGSWLGLLFLLPLIFPISTAGLKFFDASQHTFNSQMSDDYIAYIHIGILGLIIIILIRSYHFFTHHISRHAEIIIAGSVSLPLIVFQACVLANLPVGYYIFATPITVWGIYIATIHYMPTHIMIKLLDGLEKNLDEDILVTDEKGTIIYKNKPQALNYSWLKTAPYEKLEEADTLFEGAYQIVAHTENEWTAEVIDGRGCCHHVTVSKLEAATHILGYMVIIKDMTLVHDMLEEVKHLNEEVEKKNNSLMAYKEITTKYEMEKIISKLITDINNEIGEQLYVIINKAEQLHQHLQSSEEVPEEEFDDIIKVTKETLQEVRRAVRAYRTLYGEDSR